MPEIKSVRTAEHEGKEGFIVEWEFIGFTEGGAKFRAVLMTAMRFPTTITEVDVVRSRQTENRDMVVEIFVPTEGFPSAGIEQPMKWLKENFRDRIVG